MNYADSVSPKKTKQTEKTLGKDEVKNNAGGYVFQASIWTQLQRFLMIGTEGGSYYVGEQKLTKENAEVLVKCLKEDGLKVVEMIEEILSAGRAPKVEPCIFALAMAMTPSFSDLKTRLQAKSVVSSTLRIGTHIKLFAKYIKTLRGFGRAIRSAIAGYYHKKDPHYLALDLIKYANRHGFSNRDILLLGRVKPADEKANAVMRWAVGDPNRNQKDKTKGYDLAVGVASELPDIITGYDLLRTDKKDVSNANIIRQYRLPREAIPTELLNDPQIWRAMLPDMPYNALIRNLGKLGSLGIINVFSDGDTADIVKKITNETSIKKSRIHPLKIYMAMKVYKMGKGIKGNLEWAVSESIIDALEVAFYLAFDNVEQTRMRILQGVDVSSSMWFDSNMQQGVKAAEAAAVLAKVTSTQEKNVHTMAFSDELRVLSGRTLGEIESNMKKMTFGRTDCALPMLYAIEHKIIVDLFVIYTDNETWSGNIKPSQALEQYRREMNAPLAKLAVVAFTSTGFTIADPDDPGMLDIAGFDPAIPTILREFSLGNI